MPPVEFEADGHRFVADADVVVATYGRGGGFESLFFAGGPGVTADRTTLLAGPRAAGRVVGVDLTAGRVRIALDETPRPAPANSGLRFGAADAKSLAGEIVRFSSAGGTTAYAVAAAELDGNILSLTLRDDLLVGRFQVASVEGATLRTRARLMFAPSYAGVAVLDSQLRPIGRVKSALEDRVDLDSPPPDGMALAGRDVTLAGVGRGDRMEAPCIADCRLRADSEKLTRDIPERLLAKPAGLGAEGQ